MENGHQGDVADQTIRERFVDLLLDRVKTDRYPSRLHMDMLEASLNQPDQLVEYLEALMEKVENTRFPSHTMLERIQRIVAKLPA
jgi:ubiquinone biosynthesis protein COQ9